MPIVWDADCCNLMLRLRSEGMKPKDIAAHFVERGVEVTRNAIIGKLFRIDHPTYVAPAARVKRKNGIPPGASPVNTARAVAALRRDQCRYIHGDPRAGLIAFCSNRIPGAGSYCAAHHKRLYKRPGELR